jgi:hypothetical protein
MNISPKFHKVQKKYNYEKIKIIRKTIIDFWKLQIHQVGSLENIRLYGIWQGSRRVRCSKKLPPPALAHPQLVLKNPFSVVGWSLIYTSRLRSTTLFIEDFLLVKLSDTVGWWEKNENSEIFFIFNLKFISSELKLVNLAIDSPSFEAPSSPIWF